MIVNPPKAHPNGNKGSQANVRPRMGKKGKGEVRDKEISVPTFRFKALFNDDINYVPVPNDFCSNNNSSTTKKNWFLKFILFRVLMIL